MLDGTVCYSYNASLAPKTIIGSCKTWKKQVMDWYQSRTTEWQPSLSVIYKTGLLKLGWASAVRLLDISLNLTFLTILFLKGLEPNSPPSAVSLSLIPLTPLCLFLLILQHKNPKIGAVTNIEASTPSTIVVVFRVLLLVVSPVTFPLVAGGADLSWYCVTVVEKVVLVVGCTGVQVLSNRVPQYWPVALNPCLIHSGCGSSFWSKQQYEHCWQLWETSTKKYPLSHVLLQLVSDTLVQLADAISWGAHCWQFLQEDESNSAENLPEGHSSQNILDFFVSCVPHGGYNPSPGGHLSQERHLSKLPFELTIVYWSTGQILQ